MKKVFFRKFPALYLFLDLSINYFQYHYPFPFSNITALLPKIYDYHLPYSLETALKHYAFIVLNCPSIFDAIYRAKALDTNAYLTIQTLKDLNLDVIWDVEPSLFRAFDSALTNLFYVKTTADVFNQCNEQFYKNMSAIHFETDPFISQFIKPSFVL